MNAHALDQDKRALAERLLERAQRGVDVKLDNDMRLRTRSVLVEQTGDAIAYASAPYWLVRAVAPRCAIGVHNAEDLVALLDDLVAP